MPIQAESAAPAVPVAAAKEREAEAETLPPVEEPKVAYKKANVDLARQIDAIMNPELEKGEKMPPERERMRGASLLITKHLKSTGKLYNCGNVATYVDDHTHELIEITKGSPKFHSQDDELRHWT